MDNFMDKLAQKFNAQEMIKANSQAEAAEMKKLQLQVAEYEKILQEMCKLNYKYAQLSEIVKKSCPERQKRSRMSSRIQRRRPKISLHRPRNL